MYKLSLILMLISSNGTQEVSIDFTEYTFNTKTGCYLAGSIEVGKIFTNPKLAMYIRPNTDYLISCE